MKKILLIAVILLSATAMFAQQKGQFMVNGEVSFNTTKNEHESFKSRITQFSIQPAAHYFISDRWAIGLTLGYYHMKSPNIGDIVSALNGIDDFGGEKDKLNIFSFGPQGTYYLPIVDRLYYTPAVYVRFGMGNLKGDVKADVFQMKAGLTLLRFEWKATDMLGISFNAGNFDYEYTEFKDKDTDEKLKNDTFNLGFNFAPTIGFNYYF